MPGPTLLALAGQWTDGRQAVARISALNAVEPLSRVNTPESRTAAPAVFLHTGWRSGGTWLWSRCREQAGVRALYEPLHEGIADLRPVDIARLRPGSWRSSHGETAPYFTEYRSLLRRGGRGVALYERRFAFDGFFLEPEEDDHRLEAYLLSLLDADAAAGRVTVLKFCRSLGRVGWMERRFPGALHAVVMRRPMAQWQSCQRLLLRERNRYFTIAPVLVLARNAANEPVRQVCAALDVRLPRLHSANLAYGMEAVWRHLKRLDAADRYRAFLAYWTVSAVAALRSAALMIDTAEMARSIEHRTTIECALQAKLGARFDLAARAEAALSADEPHAPDMAAAHVAAAAVAVTLCSGHAPARLAFLLEHLREPGLPAPRARSRTAHVGNARSPGAIETAALVVFARALQPLRRLHGEVVGLRR